MALVFSMLDSNNDGTIKLSECQAAAASAVPTDVKKMALLRPLLRGGGREMRAFLNSIVLLLCETEAYSRRDHTPNEIARLYGCVYNGRSAHINSRTF